MRDYYYILGVAENAPNDQIKSAFRKLSMKFHPDKNNGEKFYEDRFRAIVEAWNVLSDPAKKAAYDLQLRRYRAAAADAAYKDALIRKYEAELHRYKVAAAQTPPPQPPRAAPQWQPWIRMPIHKDRHGNSIPIVPLILVGAILLIFFTSLILNHFWPDDSAIVAEQQLVDSLMREGAQTEKMERSKISPTSNNTLLLDDSKTTSLQDYLADASHLNSKVTNKDMDNDGVLETQVSYRTGGEHCCNIDHLFRRNASGDLQLIFSYMGGMYMGDDRLTLYFYQELGYYHSCYTCDVMDKLPEPDINAEINVQYSNGYILPKAADLLLNTRIERNLEFLSHNGIPDMDADGMDNGYRKAIMIQMISWHFNNHHIERTKALFDKYYSWSDKADRWKDLDAMLSRYEEIIYKNAAYRKRQTF